MGVCVLECKQQVGGCGGKVAVMAENIMSSIVDGESGGLGLRPGLVIDCMTLTKSFSLSGSQFP